MKRWLSVLTPAARLTVWKVLGVSLLAAGAQVLLFLAFFGRRDSAGAAVSALTEAVRAGRLSLVFGAGLLLVCAVLVLPGLERGVKTGYTLRRLGVDERVLTLLWGGLNTLLLLIFWAIQTAAALGLARYCFQAMPEETGNHQSLFFAFALTPYFHALLPLWDWPVVLRNVLGSAALGLSAAALPFHWRHGRKAWTLLFLAVVATVLFPAPLETSVSCGMGLFLFGAAIALMVCNVWRRYDDED